MNSGNASSAPTMEPMSTNEPNNNTPGSNPAPDAHPSADDAAAKTTEADFLQQQAEEAKAAIARAMADAKAALAEGIDPREWTRRYPLVALGSAVAAGFVAAVLAVPSKEQQELKKLEKIRRALHPEVETPRKAAAPAKDDKEDHDTKHPSFWATLLREALSLIKPVLMSAVTAGIAGKSQQPDPRHAANQPASDSVDRG